MDVVRVADVRKSFRGGMSLRAREILRGVSFSVTEGEICGFLGPNGAGKTTTIKIILGLIRPDAGDVSIFGRPVTDRSALRRVGFLPETPYFFGHLSLDEFLVLCGRMSGMGGAALRSRIEEVSETVGLAEHRGRRLGGFSKGMIQRAGLAQAILHDPDLLILDEPFSGLDPLGRIMVRDILVDLNARGRTILFSSHILPDMETLCDRTCIIRDGAIVRTVGLDELIRMGEGKVEVTARGVGEECLRTIAPYVDSRSMSQEETFLVVKERRNVNEVIRELCDSGAEIIKVVNQHPTLEKVFLSEVTRREDKTTAREEIDRRVLVRS